MLQPSVPNNQIRKGFLRRRGDFLKTYKGRLVRKPLFVLYMCLGGSKEHRLGITALKLIGPAVLRNRFKRWSREIYREMDLGEMRHSVDINVYFGNKTLNKQSYKNADFWEFKSQFNEAIKFLVRNFK